MFVMTLLYERWHYYLSVLLNAQLCDEEIEEEESAWKTLRHKFSRLRRILFYTYILLNIFSLSSCNNAFNVIHSMCGDARYTCKTVKSQVVFLCL